MNVTCPSCAAAYALDITKIPPQGGIMPCQNCSTQITIPPPDSTTVVMKNPLAPEEGVVESAEKTVVSSVSEQMAGDMPVGDWNDGTQTQVSQRYYVRHQGGDAFGPFAAEQLQPMADRGELNTASEVSTVVAIC